MDNQRETLARKGILLLALGSPSAPNVPAVKTFLRAFLGDRRVIALPWFLRKILLECVILPFRSKHAATRYQKIWTPEGSPFSVFTNSLRARVQERAGENVPVRVAMRYGEPSVARALREFSAAGTSEITVIPQFPHYAKSSYETAVEHFEKMRARFAPHLRAKIVPPFYAAQGYIAALAASVKNVPEMLVFSFHGVPLKSICGKANCDLASPDFDSEKCTACAIRARCYRRQCYATANAVATQLGLPPTRYKVAFQSRFGRGKWLVPATEEVLAGTFPDTHSGTFAGTPKLAVIAPGFTVDCLETLEELDIAGVERVPCLNDSPVFADFLASLAS